MISVSCIAGIIVGSLFGFLVSRHYFRKSSAGTLDTGPPPPPGWGEDLLSDYLNRARQNTFATFARLPRFYAHLREVDLLFSRFADGLKPDEPLTALLTIRAHSVYRTAVGVALSGAAFEIHSLIRACIELSTYAHHIWRDLEQREEHPAEDSADEDMSAGEKWLRRDESDETRKAAKREFTWANVRQSLNDADPGVADRVQRAYEDAIGMGGHPNPLGILVLTSINKGESGTEHATDFLVGDSLQLRSALHLVARTGICALDVIRLIYPSQFSSLGLDEPLVGLMRDHEQLRPEVLQAPEQKQSGSNNIDL